MANAGPGHRPPADGERHVTWRVLAWAVPILIAVAGLALGVRECQQSEREPMKLVCARAGDVQDSLLTILRARISRLDPSSIDFDALHAEVRELNGAANEAESTAVRRAASSARQHLELVTSETYQLVAEGAADTPAWNSMIAGARGLGVIRDECERQGFPVSEVPSDLLRP